MAGDWIKMRTNLDSDPRVCEIANILGISELHVVGCLWKLWSWADEHTLNGNAVSVTKVTLDRFCCVTGFCEALTQVGWLVGSDRNLVFPRFEEHNGQTAKQRAMTAKRVANFKEKQKQPTVKNGNALVTLTALPREEKRRDEKSIKEIPLPLFPENLNSDEFKKSWDGFIRHRKEKKKPLTPTQTEKQLEKLSGWGLRRSIAAIEHSVANGWDGIFEPSTDATSAPGIAAIGKGERFWAGILNKGKADDA